MDSKEAEFEIVDKEDYLDWLLEMRVKE